MGHLGEIRDRMEGYAKMSEVPSILEQIAQDRTILSEDEVILSEDESIREIWSANWMNMGPNWDDNGP